MSLFRILQINCFSHIHWSSQNKAPSSEKDSSLHKMKERSLTVELLISQSYWIICSDIIQGSVSDEASVAEWTQYQQTST